MPAIGMKMLLFFFKCILLEKDDAVMDMRQRSIITV